MLGSLLASLARQLPELPPQIVQVPPVVGALAAGQHHSRDELAVGRVPAQRPAADAERLRSLGGAEQLVWIHSRDANGAGLPSHPSWLFETLLSLNIRIGTTVTK
jgi:hypothetical protein